MKILDLGSMNLDYVYHVDHIVQPGETEASSGMDVFLGGKGMNQAVALAKAGAEVYMGGMIGKDGQPFLDACIQYGVRPDYIRQIDGKSGHAIIQLDTAAQNCILLYGGANRCLTEAYVDEVLSHFGSGDILLLQNEINQLSYIVDRAHDKGMTIALNPSPFDDKLKAVDLEKISVFLLNEVEGFQITGHNQPHQILEELLNRYPKARIVLTLGRNGAVYADAKQRCYQPIFKTKAVDTTAAGDTFTGYFLAGMCEQMPVADTLALCAKASAITVSRKGAVPAIPYREEVEAFAAQADTSGKFSL